MKNEIVTAHVVHIMSVMLQTDIVDTANFAETIRMVAREVHEVLNQDYLSTTKD